MSFKKEIEQYLEQVSVLEESFRKVKDLDTLPVSFFSVSLDVLNQLESGLYELESSQLQMMAAHLDENENLINSSAGEPVMVNELAEFKGIKEAKENVADFLGDKISKEKRTDFTKSLTINQHFMFLRDIFKGDETKMNSTLTTLNVLETLEDAVDYMDDEHLVQWETESGVAFKELLEKLFI